MDLGVGIKVEDPTFLQKLTGYSPYQGLCGLGNEAFFEVDPTQEPNYSLLIL